MTDPIPTTDQWPIGVALILGASFIGGLGDNLIRYSHRKNNTKTPNYFMFIWMVGMFCTIVLNTMCTVAAFAYADSSLILPFAGTHVIFAVVLAIVINNEKVTMKSWLVLSIILFGILTTVIAGNKETINYSLELMMLLFAKPLFLVVASLILIICLLAFLAFNARWLTPGFQAMSISVVAGIFGSFGSIFAKTAVEIIKAVDATKYSKGSCWLIIILAIVSGALQITAYNHALKLYQAALVAPIVLSTMIVFGVTLGVIYFQEYNRFKIITMICLPFGITLTLFGIFLLAYFASVDAEEKKKLETCTIGDREERESLLEKLSSETPHSGDSI